MQDMDLHKASHPLKSNTNRNHNDESANSRALQDFPKLRLDADNLETNDGGSKSSSSTTHRLETYHEKLTGIPVTSMAFQKAYLSSGNNQKPIISQQDFPYLPKSSHSGQKFHRESSTSSSKDHNSASLSKEVSNSKKKDKKVLFRFG